MAGVVSYPARRQRYRIRQGSSGKGGATMVSANNGGDGGGEQVQRFGWTGFYMAVADALLRYRDDRRPLADGIAEIAARRPGLPFAITDQFPPDRSRRPMEDICPFTAMGVFNRSLTDSNRRAIAGELAQFLQVAEPAPAFSYKDDGIPLLNNQRSWFFHFAYLRKHDAIDTLWEIFAAALALADGKTDNRAAFIRCYDAAQSQPLVRYNLTMGLYWARPWRYPTLDSNSRNIICNLLSVRPMRRVPSGADYLGLADNLQDRFDDPGFPVHSFPQLSWVAYQPGPPPQPWPAPVRPTESEPQPEPLPELTPEPSQPDTGGNRVDDSFVDRARQDLIGPGLAGKQDIILERPSNTGKSWLAKWLAALWRLIRMRGG